MNSLNTRLLVAASIVLAAFLSFMGFALDQAFAESARVAVKERLQIEIYTLLAAANSDGESLVLPAGLPQARYSTPASGLYAEVISDEGESIWRSRSSLGMEISYPNTRQKGKAHFSEVQNISGKTFFSIGLSVTWEVGANLERGFTFYVAETQQQFEQEVVRFRKSMASWLGAAVLVLLIVQATILRWGLAPLRKVAAEVTEIEEGKKTELSSDYPVEIKSLTTNLNALVRSSHSHLIRYRDALGDLAHSLKTPLAVLRNVVENDELPDQVRETVLEQLERLDNTVAYQLQRAVATGRKALAVPVNINDVAKKLRNSFEKVYLEKGIQFRFDIDQDLRFIGDEGDLMEILGNITDNACKWCRSVVSVKVFSSEQKKLIILVDDDGPGIAIEKQKAILKRGVRGDSQVDGHGIGMAVVRNLVEEVYRGKLSVSKSELGGAKIRVELTK